MAAMVGKAPTMLGTKCRGGGGGWWGCESTAWAVALPSTQGGRGQCVRREAAVAALPFVHHSTMALCFHGRLGFLHKHSQLQIFSLPSLQAVSSQPTAVLSLRPLSKLHIPAPSPCCTHLSGWDMQGCVKDHLCKSHSVLPATDQLLRSPLIALEALLLSQLISL